LIIGFIGNDVLADRCVEEVYFGKAKDVVGDLRSKSNVRK